LNSIKDVVARTRLSRSKVYEEMDSGRLKSVKVGRRRLVTESQLIDFIDALIEAGTPDGGCCVTPDAVVEGDVVRPGTAVVRP
jgi:excisionase family DNA binding protein